MLKFLRKYQLILLAVGGSLLMVVFLLEPVLRQLTPDPAKREVAKIGDGTTLTLGEQTRANVEMDLLERFLPTFPMLLGIDPEERAAHWMLLKHEAERLGVMGIAQDGADWIPELAFELAQSQVNNLRRQGQAVTQEDADQILENSNIFLNQQQDRLIQVNRLNEQAFYEVLSTARGVMRMRRLYGEAPRLSRQRVMSAFDEMGTGVLIDQVVIGPELLADEVAEPTEAELEAQLERYASVRAGETTDGEGGQFGFGYLLPARVKLEWLQLDPAAIREAVSADPVRVRRRWQERGDDSVPFAEARGEIEEEIRGERVQQIMVDADEIVRGEILGATRGLEKQGIYRKLPEGWTAPDLEKIAGDVVEAIQDRHGVRITRPVVERRTDGWLTPAELNALPGVGRAVYRVGTRQARAAVLPSLVRGIGGSNDSKIIAVQKGLPVVDPVAEDPTSGAKYYITVLDAVDESPPAGVDEIRERLVTDVKARKAYELLTDRLDVYRETATRDGLEALAAMFAGSEGGSPVTVRENILVNSERMAPATFRSFPDQRADRPVYREAVMAEAEDLSPLAEPDSSPLSQSIVGVGVPSSRVVAFARIRAKVPASAEAFRAQAPMVVMSARANLLGEKQGLSNPLDFGPMAERLGYQRLGENGDAETGDSETGDGAAESSAEG